MIDAFEQLESKCNKLTLELELQRDTMIFGLKQIESARTLIAASRNKNDFAHQLATDNLSDAIRELKVRLGLIC